MDNEVLLCQAENLLEAKMMVEVLNNNGIAAYYKNNSPLQYFEHLGADFKQPQMIYVMPEDVERASELLDLNK